MALYPLTLSTVLWNNLDFLISKSMSWLLSSTSLAFISSESVLLYQMTQQQKTNSYKSLKMSILFLDSYLLFFYNVFFYWRCFCPFTLSVPREKHTQYNLSLHLPHSQRHYFFLLLLEGHDFLPECNFYISYLHCFVSFFFMQR